MIKYFVAISLFALFSSVFSSDKELRSINLIVKTPYNTPRGADLFLTGEGASLCNWRPNCLKFRKIDNQLYKINLVLIDRPKLLEFKITRGSWENEACNQIGEVLPNYELMTNSGSVDYTLTIENWCDQDPFKAPQNIVKISKLELVPLGLKRDLKVYLPSTYDKYPNRKFPVIYMHDGQNSIDPSTSAFGKEWGVDETIETLIKRKQSDGFVVVAIPCHCKDRNLEYNFFEKGSLYARSLIVESIIPYIDQNFRTIANESSTQWAQWGHWFLLVSLGISIGCSAPLQGYHFPPLHSIILF